MSPLRDRTLIVIPAYNEAQRIGAVIADVSHALPEADVLVVDDGSSDNTRLAARSAGAAVVTLPVNLGYGAALQTGYKWAVRGGYSLLGQLDGDGQHSPDYLPAMLRALSGGGLLGEEGADVVIGSRFLGHDGHYKPSLARRVGMALFSRVASAVMHQHITDPTSGLQAMRLPVAEFFCSEVYPSDFPDADILILLHRCGFRVRELPVQMKPPSGKSMHAGHRSLYYVYKMWLSIFVTMLRPSIFRSEPCALD